MSEAVPETTARGDGESRMLELAGDAPLPRSRRPQRVCLVGIDAGDTALIDRWSRDGTLPTFELLRRHGAWMALPQVPEFPSSGVWPSIYTGTHPGRHGLYHTTRLVPGTWTLGSTDLEELPEAPIWRVLGDAGLQSIVVDVPFAPPVPGLRGVQIADWGSYEHPGPPWSIPDSVLPDLIGRFGPYPVDRDLSRELPLTTRDRRRARRQLLEGVAAKGGVLRWLARHEPWDLLFGVFAETHAAGHYFWRGEDGVEPRDPEPSTTPLREVYLALDGELRKLLDVVDTTTTLVMIVSGHGMRKNVGAPHLLDPILTGLGLLSRNADGPRGRVLRTLRGWVPVTIRRSVSQYLPDSVQASMSAYWVIGSIDRARTRALALPTGGMGYLRVNLAGREPDGIVTSGREYDEVCAGIAGTLERLVDPRTGRPVVKEVFRADQRFPGPASHRLPDLFVSWAKDAPRDAVHSPEIGTIMGPPTDLRTGNHRAEGFAILYGLGAPAGQRVDGSLLDVVPTILDCFGLPVSLALKGRSWVMRPVPI